MCNLLVSCETTREVVQICVDPARFNKRAGSKVFEPLFFFLLVSWLTKLAWSKLFGSMCNLLVSFEATREVVQICLTRHDSTSVPDQKMFEPLVSKIDVD